MLGAAGAGFTSCNDLLDLEPINQITPESYYSSADQLASYMNQYYNDYLTGAYSSIHHPQGYNDGMARSDGNTDIMVAGLGGNTTLFADGHWEVPSGKQLQGRYGGVRIFNYFINTAEAKYAEGQISGDDASIKHYIGEGYFFRAMTYFNMMVLFGDLPIIKEVLEDKDEVIIENSKRTPRNEVARFILSDLDKAISMLKGRDAFNGQRVSKEAALLFKSRVALFEGTFEKYHKGSGRVPGDANWPGGSFSGNIDAEVSFFLTEAMNAAKQVGDNAQLTENNHAINPAIGIITGWNPYFEMYSQPSLKNVPEVLLWKEYSRSLGSTHDVPFRVKVGCADGYTRTFTESFLCQDGLPIYASPNYKGDVSLDNVKANRDERLQLFLWGESDYYDTDPASLKCGNPFERTSIMESNQEIRCITGYQPRKYYTYDYDQTPNDEMRGTNACPIFRTAEALLNYMEACYELNGQLDGTATNYWKQLRTRAGVSTDIDATIAATDLSKEGAWSVYSGTNQVSTTLYNIRRERMCETFSEGLRYQDLIRWRSFDKLLTEKWIPEGCNFWDNIHTYYSDYDITADGSSDAIVSGPEQSKYLRPYSRNLGSSNELRDGYMWHEAYYLYPIGIQDLRTASPDRDVATSVMYQNVNWPSTEGHPLK